METATCNEIIYKKIFLSPLRGKRLEKSACFRPVKFDVSDSYSGLKTQVCGICARKWRKKARVKVTPIKKEMK